MKTLCEDSVLACDVGCGTTVGLMYLLHRTPTDHHQQSTNPSYNPHTPHTKQQVPFTPLPQKDSVPVPCLPRPWPPPQRAHSVSTGQCLPLTPPTSPRRPHRPRPTHTHPLHSSRRRHANCQNLPTMDPTIPRWSTLGGEESSSYPIASRIPSAGPVLWS